MIANQPEEFALNFGSIGHHECQTPGCIHKGKFSYTHLKEIRRCPRCDLPMQKINNQGEKVSQ